MMVLSKKVVKVLVERDDVIRVTKNLSRQIKLKCSELSIQGERILGIVNVHRKNTRNRQCKVSFVDEFSGLLWFAYSRRRDRVDEFT